MKEFNLLPPLHVLNEELEYWPSKGHLYNKKSRGPRAKKGARAGYFCKGDGYRKIRINKIAYQEHRVIFKMHYGIEPPQPPYELDHLDKDKTHNYIKNLKVKTRPDNKRNINLSKKNTTNYRGVSPDKRRNIYVAFATIDGKTHYIGSSYCPIEAAKKRDEYMVIAYYKGMIGFYPILNF